MEIVTKAKKSCTAFEKTAPKKPGRGRPPKKGAAVHLKDLFVSRREQFRQARVELYGKQETVRYYCVDLALQLPFPDRMYISGAQAADRGILLSLLVKAYAQTESFPENRGG